MAVSLKKPNEEHKVENSSSSGLPEYTPVHLIDEEETIRHSAPPKKADTTTVIGSLPECTSVHLRGEDETQQSLQPNSGETAAKSLKIPLAIVAVVAFVAVIVMLAGNKGSTENTPVLANSGVSEISHFSDTEQIGTSTNYAPEQSNTSSFFEIPTQTTASSTPFGYGSMGSVTIMGVEYDIATTTELNLSDKNVTDDVVKQIAQLTNLTRLYLDKNPISNLTPLAGLKNLTTLSLYECQITYIMPLAGLTNLETLLISNNQISDITPLRGLKKLETLYLHDNQISDITPLSGLTGLGELNLDFNWIDDITPLSGLTDLYILSLDGNRFDDISPLSGLTNLSVLSFRGILINDSDILQLIEELPDCAIYF